MRKRRYAIVFLLFLCVVVCSGCASIFDVPNADILTWSDPLSSYTDVLRSALPSETVQPSVPGNLPAALETDAFAVEAFEPQAYGYLRSGAAQAFYPHYLATVVIAVDRDRVADEINSWSDLLSGTYTVALPGGLSVRYAVLAMSVGLDDGTYDMTNALRLINRLNTLGRVVSASSEPWGADAEGDFEQSSVAVLFDYQAASLKKAGRNIEIIVPSEGTLCLPVGLLCDRKLDLDETELTAQLLGAGFRLPDGSCDPALYPDDYTSARMVDDDERFNLAYRDITARLRREGWGSYQWTTADGDEHAISFLAFFVVVILWGGAVYMRTLHRSVRRSMAAIIGLLILRVALRYVKTLFGEALFVGRFIWYCYYIPLLLLPVFCLWLAWTIDKPEDQTRPPRWWWIAFGGACALILLTLTNDLHQLVFTFQPGFANWMRDYGFAAGYYLFLAFFGICSACSVALLVRKAGRAGIMSLLPLVVIVLLGGAFMAADYAGVTFVAQMQTPFVSAVLLLLFFETALRTGFIPSNSKYGVLFAAAPVDMKILQHNGVLFRETRHRVEEPYAEFCTDIRGGYTVLRVDLSAQVELKKSLEAKNLELVRRTEVLKEEQHFKDELLTLQIQNKLYDEVEQTVREKARQISDIVATIPRGISSFAVREKLARAAVLTSYVKCRSNLLLTGKEADRISLFDLAQLTRDSTQSARVAGVDCAVYIQDHTIPLQAGVLAYDLFEHALEHALQLTPCDMTASFTVQSDALRLTVVISVLQDFLAQELCFAPDAALLEALHGSGCVVETTVEDETLVVNAVLPLEQGGGSNG